MIITILSILPVNLINNQILTKMPFNKRLNNILKNKKNKKVEPESSSSESENDYSSSESESESEYKPSSPSNGSRTNSASNNEDEDENTVYTECNSGEEKESDEEDEKLDNKKFRKTIAKIFPSRYSKTKAKEMDETDKEQKDKRKKHNTHLKQKSKKIQESDSDDEYEWSEEDSESECATKNKKSSRNKISDKSTNKKSQQNNKKSTKHDKKQKRKHKHKIDDSESNESEEDSDEEIAEKKQFLILSLGGDKDDDDLYDDDDDEADSLTEDTTEEFDSDAEKTFMGDAYETVVAPKKKQQKSPSKTRDKSKSKSSDTQKDQKNKPKEEDDRHPIPANIEDEYKEMLDVRKMLLEQLKRRPNNKFLKSSLDECNADIKKLTRKARHENTNAYYKLVNSDKKQTNEIDYFKHRLSNKDQQGIMADLKEINHTIYSEKPYRLSILQSKIPSKFKALAIQRLNMLKSMEPGDHEYYKIKNWVDAFMRIPFGVYRSIHIKMTDGIDICNEFMESAKKTLDNCVYGLNDAKLQIMQMLGQWIVNPESVGTSIAIHGPPGSGKTSIVKDGISKILGREFAFIALGGCGDGSFLEGHSYTYEGSMWGKIVQILMECKSMNPIIYFDELDKVSDSPRGQEIIGILTHLTDTSQNAEFHDKYFSEVSLDLSKCLFIFSYNDENAVNPILKDRMYRIQTKGYDSKEKITIARDYLLPKIREQVKFAAEDIIISDDTLQHIISTPHLTKSEAGVRNLKRCLEIIYTKLNLYRLVKPGNSMFEKDLGVKVEFPINITRKEVDVFIKNNETMNPSVLAMYM